MNGWYPRISPDAVIASGNDSVWVSDATGAHLYAAAGLAPVWLGRALLFNRNDNATINVGGQILPAVYNDYRGSDTDRWAGFNDRDFNRQGSVTFYTGLIADVPIAAACTPRIGGARTGYLTPFQTAPDNIRRLVLTDGTAPGAIVAEGVIVDWVIDRAGAFYVYQVGTGTYTRQIKDEHGAVVSINDSEAPIVAFTFQGERWLVTASKGGVFVRPLSSPFGYRLIGDLFYPDARLFGANLLVTSSSSSGVLRRDWVNLYDPRVDLRIHIGDTA